MDRSGYINCHKKTRQFCMCLFCSKLNSGPCIFSTTLGTFIQKTSQVLDIRYTFTSKCVVLFQKDPLSPNICRMPISNVSKSLQNQYNNKKKPFKSANPKFENADVTLLYSSIVKTIPSLCKDHSCRTISQNLEPFDPEQSTNFC